MRNYYFKYLGLFPTFVSCGTGVTSPLNLPGLPGCMDRMAREGAYLRNAFVTM